MCVLNMHKVNIIILILTLMGVTDQKEKHEKVV